MDNKTWLGVDEIKLIISKLTTSRIMLASHQAQYEMCRIDESLTGQDVYIKALDDMAKEVDLTISQHKQS